MSYSYTLSMVIPASPVEIYEAWLDSVAHAEMTGGGEAVMSDEVGAEISALDGQITGRNLELVPTKRIVQSWRTAEFDDETEDSIVTILLQETEDGTVLTLEHSNVPDHYKSYEEGGWQSNYFEPMVAYFNEFEDDFDEPGQNSQPAATAESEPDDEAEGGDEPAVEHQRELEPEYERETEFRSENAAEYEPETEREPETEQASDAQHEPEAEHAHERQSERHPDVTAMPNAPPRAARGTSRARARTAPGRERGTGGLTARKATPRGAVNRGNVAAPETSVAERAEKPATNKKAAQPTADKNDAKQGTNKKATKSVTNKKATKPAAKKAAKSSAKKKQSAKKKTPAKKKTAKPAAKRKSANPGTKKKTAKKSAQRSAKRSAAKTATRSSAAGSRKSRRGKR
jgi:uncharacterized protein YndB with AHSA1/START domain